MKNAKSLFPGWRMTVLQHGRYFREFAAACRAQNATTSLAKDRLRHDAHIRAFGLPYKSATEINKTKEFDAILKEFERLAYVVPKPSPGGEQNRGEQNSGERKRVLFVAQQRLAVLERIASPNYVSTLLKQRFKIIPGLSTVEGLNLKQLTDLISTVNNRIRQLQPAPEVEVDCNNPF
jgi:hypothetical protein